MELWILAPSTCGSGTRPDVCRKSEEGLRRRCQRFVVSTNEAKRHGFPSALLDHRLLSDHYIPKAGASRCIRHECRSPRQCADGGLQRGRPMLQAPKSEQTIARSSCLLASPSPTTFRQRSGCLWCACLTNAGFPGPRRSSLAAAGLFFLLAGNINRTHERRYTPVKAPYI